MNFPWFQDKTVTLPSAAYLVFMKAFSLSIFVLYRLRFYCGNLTNSVYLKYLCLM